MDKFVKDAFLLFIGSFVSKFIGLLFIFPFSNMIGAIGLSLYTYAYVPYALFLDLATLGVPMGISKLVAKNNANNNLEYSKLLYKKCVYLMIAIGFCSFVILNIVAKPYAKIVLGGSLDNNLADVILVIRIISLALLIVPNIALMRGFFQGNLKMLPTTLSQIVEQVIRVSVILIGCYYYIYVRQKSVVSAVNLAVFSAFLGAVFALVVLLLFMRKMDLLTSKDISSKQLYKDIFKYAIPYAFYGISLSLYHVVDSMTFNRGLLKYGVANPEVYYGIYAFEVQKLIQIPIIIASSLAAAIMPNLTMAKKISDINNIIDKSLNILIYFLLPIMVYFLIFSSEIYRLLYQNIEIGPSILFYSSLLIIFLGVNSGLIGIMQGLNFQKQLIKTLVISLMIKIGLNGLLISYLGYQGAILATISSLAFSIAMSMYTLKRAQMVVLRRLVKSFLFMIMITVSCAIILILFKKYIQLANEVIYLGCSASLYFFSYYLLMKKSPFYYFQIK